MNAKINYSERFQRVQEKKYETKQNQNVRFAVGFLLLAFGALIRINSILNSGRLIEALMYFLKISTTTSNGWHFSILSTIYVRPCFLFCPFFACLTKPGSRSTVEIRTESLGKQMTPANLTLELHFFLLQN